MIVTLGEAMMVFNGPPEGPIALGSPVNATFAGAESNVAIGLARLGHAVRYVTVLGDDPFGRVIYKTLRGEGVDVSGVQFSADHPTGVMFKNSRPGDEPEVFYYRKASAFARAGPGTFDSALRGGATILYLTGITPALSPTCLALVRELVDDAHRKDVPVWLDPNYRRKLWAPSDFRNTLAGLLNKVDTILPGLAEGELLTGRTEPDEIAQSLMGAGVRNVILKAGDGGAIAYSEGDRVAAEPYAIDRVVDPIGAGDAFSAGYLSGHLDGLAAQACLRRGHAVAARVCQTRGDWEGLPTRRELGRMLTREGDVGR